MSHRVRLHEQEDQLSKTRNGTSKKYTDWDSSALQQKGGLAEGPKLPIG